MATILIVDDDDLVAEMLQFRLVMQGYTVHRASNGQEGVAQALALQPELVLMDMRMPVMNGDEAVRKLREGGYTGVIVSLSASAMQSEVVRAMEVGCDYSMTKPIGRDFEDKIGAFLLGGHPH